MTQMVVFRSEVRYLHPEIAVFPYNQPTDAGEVNAEVV
jgi:hypothetical protein